MNNIFYKIKKKLFYKFFKKKFSSFEQAKNFCDKISKNSYENEYLSNYRLEKFLASINNINNNKPKSFYFLNKTIEIYQSKFQNNPRILEIGGSFGENCYALESINKKDIIFSVLESHKIKELSIKLSTNINYILF